MAAFKPLGDQLDIFGALDAAESVSVLDSPVRDIPRPVLSKPVADTASVLRAEAEARSAVAAAGACLRASLRMQAKSWCSIVAIESRPASDGTIFRT